WAQRMGQPVAEMLAQVVQSSLAPLGPEPGDDRPMTEWSDEEVLAAVDLQLPAETDRRLSELLDLQQRRPLIPTEQVELRAYMTSYEEGLLRKARALHEAARRGLRGPVQP